MEATSPRLTCQQVGSFWGQYPWLVDVTFSCPHTVFPLGVSLSWSPDCDSSHIRWGSTLMVCLSFGGGGALTGPRIEPTPVLSLCCRALTIQPLLCPEMPYRQASNQQSHPQFPSWWQKKSTVLSARTRLWNKRSLVLCYLRGNQPLTLAVRPCVSPACTSILSCPSPFLTSHYLPSMARAHPAHFSWVACCHLEVSIDGPSMWAEWGFHGAHDPLGFLLGTQPFVVPDRVVCSCKMGKSKIF